MNRNQQNNTINVDYTIDNLNLITIGANFNDYANKLSVQALPNSSSLTGSFQIKFELKR